MRRARPLLHSLLGLVGAAALTACSGNAMTAGCFSYQLHADLVGSWRYVGRPPPPDGDTHFDDMTNPHAESLELLADGTYAQRYAGEQLARIRKAYPEATEVRSGEWTVAKYCAGDLFLPSEWLRLYPGPRVRRFHLEGDRLTILYPFGSGRGDEIYERQAASAGQ